MDSLHTGGYTVIVKQVGVAPLTECSATKLLGPDHTAVDAGAGVPCNLSPCQLLRPAHHGFGSDTVTSMTERRRLLRMCCLGGHIHPKG